MRAVKSVIIMAAGSLVLANLFLGINITHFAISICTALALSLFLYTEQTANLMPANHVVTGAMPLLLMLNIIAVLFIPEAIYPFTFILFFISDFFIFRKASIRTGIFSGIIVYIFSAVVVLFLVRQIPALQTTVLKHLPGPSNPGIAAAIFLNSFVIILTIAVFFFEPRQRGFIHTNDLISSRRKFFLSVASCLLRSSLLFIVYSTSGLSSIPVLLATSIKKPTEYLFSVMLLFAWFEIIPLARYFGFETVIVPAALIIGFSLYFANSRRSTIYDQCSRSLIFSLRQRSSL
jgi:hypothetical protein